MSLNIAALAAAVNDHDLQPMSAFFDADYRSVQPAHPARAFVGNAQVLANWTAMFAGIPDVRAELGWVAQDGETTWCEWTWSGTRTDGLPFKSTGVVLFESRDQVITVGTFYTEEVEADGAGIDQTVQGKSGHLPGDGSDPDQTMNQS